LVISCGRAEREDGDGLGRTFSAPGDVGGKSMTMQRLSRAARRSVRQSDPGLCIVEKSVRI